MTAGTENLLHSIEHTGRWKRHARIESVIEAVAIVLVGWFLLIVWG